VKVIVTVILTAFVNAGPASTVAVGGIVSAKNVQSQPEN
jgi:hypothetical protein